MMSCTRTGRFGLLFDKFELPPLLLLRLSTELLCRDTLYSGRPTMRCFFPGDMMQFKRAAGTGAAAGNLQGTEALL